MIRIGGRPHLHYTELPEPGPNSGLAVEWNTYRREVGRLLAEGHEGKYLLIKGEEVLGIFPTKEAADEEGRRRFLLRIARAWLWLAHRRRRLGLRHRLLQHSNPVLRREHSRKRRCPRLLQRKRSASRMKRTRPRSKRSTI